MSRGPGPPKRAHLFFRYLGGVHRTVLKGRALRARNESRRGDAPIVCVAAWRRCGGLRCARPSIRARIGATATAAQRLRHEGGCEDAERARRGAQEEAETQCSVAAVAVGAAAMGEAAVGATGLDGRDLKRTAEAAGVEDRRSAFETHRATAVLSESCDPPRTDVVFVRRFPKQNAGQRGDAAHKLDGLMSGRSPGKWNCRTIGKMASSKPARDCNKYASSLWNTDLVPVSIGRMCTG